VVPAQGEAFHVQARAEALEGAAIPAEEVRVALPVAGAHQVGALPLVVAEALVEGLGGADHLAGTAIQDPQLPLVGLEALAALGAPGQVLAVRRIARRVVHGLVVAELLRRAAAEGHLVDLAVGGGGLGLVRVGFEGQGLGVRGPGVAVPRGDIGVVGHVRGEARREIPGRGAAIGGHHEEVAHLLGILPGVPVAVAQGGVEAARDLGLFPSLEVGHVLGLYAAGHGGAEEGQPLAIGTPGLAGGAAAQPGELALLPAGEIHDPDLAAGLVGELLPVGAEAGPGLAAAPQVQLPGGAARGPVPEAGDGLVGREVHRAHLVGQGPGRQLGGGDPLDPEEVVDLQRARGQQGQGSQEEEGRAHGDSGNQYSDCRYRAMTIRWISLVPSPMVQSFTSR